MTKKLLLAFLVLIQCTGLAQTRPSYFQLMNAPIIDAEQYKVGRTDAQALNAAATATRVATNSPILFVTGAWTIDAEVDFRGIPLDASRATITASGAHEIRMGDIFTTWQPQPGPEQKLLQFSGTVRITESFMQKITVEKATKVIVYSDADEAVSQAAIVFSEFTFGRVPELELNTNPSPTSTDSQWINENKFTMRQVDNVLIDGTYAHNGNFFSGGDMEGAATITINVGHSNHFRNLRCEGPINAGELGQYQHYTGGTNITCATGTFNNTFEANHLSYSPKITNHGHPSNRWWHRGYDKEYVLFAVDHQNAHRSVFFTGFNTNSVASPSGYLTVASSTQFFNSPFIPAFYSTETPNTFPHAFAKYQLDVYGLPGNGRLEVYVDGYNSSGAPIASTGVDVIDQSYNSGGAPFGTRVNSFYNYAPDGAPWIPVGTYRANFAVVNPSAAWIRIRCKADPSGDLKFRQLVLRRVGMKEEGYADLAAFGVGLDNAMTKSAVVPTAIQAGQTYYSTATNSAYIFNGSAWVKLDN